MLQARSIRNPIPRRAISARFPLPVGLRRVHPVTRALAPVARALRIFREQLAPLGCKVEFSEGGEDGVFISLPSVGFSDYGRDLDEAIQNFVERAREVAAMRKAPGERWTKGLEAQHQLLKKALG